jgi:hypothetical protein
MMKPEPTEERRLSRRVGHLLEEFFKVVVKRAIFRDGWMVAPGAFLLFGFRLGVDADHCWTVFIDQGDKIGILGCPVRSCTP